MRLLLIAAALAAAASAQAGVLSTMTGAKAPPGDERKYDPLTLKPAELKSCLVDAYSIDVADALFEAERPRVEEEREELKKLREASLAKPSSSAVAADTELRLKSRAFNAKIAALNSRVAYAQDARDRFSRTCKGRRYFFEDLAAVRRELPVEVRQAIAVPPQ
jgi:hypothetical protein